MCLLWPSDHAVAFGCTCILLLVNRVCDSFVCITIKQQYFEAFVSILMISARLMRCMCCTHIVMKITFQRRLILNYSQISVRCVEMDSIMNLWLLFTMANGNSNSNCRPMVNNIIRVILSQKLIESHTKAHHKFPPISKWKSILLRGGIWKLWLRCIRKCMKLLTFLLSANKNA